MFDDFDEDLLDEEEAPASPSGAQGLQPPRLMQDCLGHAKVEQTLLEMAQGTRTPHALIFSGTAGIGKATMAFRFARYLLKYGRGNEEQSAGLFGESLPESKPQSLAVNSEDPVFRQVASGGHPDLLTIGRLFDDKNQKQKTTVEVDEVRRITPFLRMTASQGGWRVVIVDDADTMNRSAQNAILKILEEPPPQAMLILIAHRIGAMIPTIRSRCRSIHFTVPDRGTFDSLIRRNHGTLSANDLDTLYAISSGSIGQACRIAEEGGLEAVGKVSALMHNWPDWPWSQIHGLAETLGRAGQEDSLRAFQDVMLWIVDEILRAKARQAPLPGILDNEATRNLLQAYSLPQWIEISGQIHEHFDKVAAASLDKRYAVLGVFSLFEPKEAA